MNCEANLNFDLVALGGDGDSMQYWFVGYDLNLDTVIVSHQSTDLNEILPLVTDDDIMLVNPDSSFFTRLSLDIEVDQGFTAMDILSAVQTTMSTYRTNQITIVDHSLRAAILLLDSVYLLLYIPDAFYAYFSYRLPQVKTKPS
ncbi:uncharacterized protein LAESUDRAFT_795597 [Laetiporus sulphureus 93-53]|uniref:Fungal lipase-like domain-containing protein n=1 Tax=Laetiporus sulphureus 93-53 TaxID=1314785 RepID=A0A165BU53_9APHY|nr:uncharacterized protein LAESUDRAFT_795597 [Laetiporus sulphureus 93-53]KZT01655.1 hypothetical protein LAESUDRAFT_795597 [Laetiporus sulphureus 93-53]